MTIQDLIDKLQKVEDKTLSIRVIHADSEDEENYWLGRLEVSEKGQSGYEMNGEVRLIGYE